MFIMHLFDKHPPQKTVKNSLKNRKILLKTIPKLQRIKSIKYGYREMSIMQKTCWSLGTQSSTAQGRFQSPRNHKKSITKYKHMNTKAIKPGPKPNKPNGTPDERRRVTPPNQPKHPDLKPHIHKPKD